MGFIYLTVIYVATEMGVLEEMLQDKLKFIAHQCPSRDTLIVVGDFHAFTDAGRWLWGMCLSSLLWQ